MNNKIGKCTGRVERVRGCGRNKVIVNKTLNLCQECNKKRLQDEREDSLSIAAKNLARGRISKEGAKRMKAYEGAVRKKDKEFYRELRAMWGEDCRCSGCNRKVNMDSPTTYSHIIPKKRRQDLRWESDNMVPDCWDCHHIWDNMPWDKKVKLMNIGERLRYIAENDEELYNAYIAKIEDYT